MGTDIGGIGRSPVQSGSRIPINRALVPSAASSPMPATATPVEPARGTDPGRGASSRPSPALAAQLLAARENLAQSRRLRRAEPADAVAAYRAAAALGTCEAEPRADRRI